MTVRQINEHSYSISWLANAFELDRRTVSKRIQGIEPSGKSNGHPVYRLVDVAPALIDSPPQAASENDPDSMVPFDRDKWYASEQKRIALEEKAGRLLDYDETQMLLARALKSLQQNILAAPDMAESMLGLTPEQSERMVEWADSLLRNLRKELAEL